MAGGTNSSRSDESSETEKPTEAGGDAPASPPNRRRGGRGDGDDGERGPLKLSVEWGLTLLVAGLGALAVYPKAGAFGAIMVAATVIGVLMWVFRRSR